MKTYSLKSCPEDRLVVMADGIPQSGIGTGNPKSGWRVEGCKRPVLEQVRRYLQISARTLWAGSSVKRWKTRWAERL